jgi:hypothetical protein
MFTIRFGSCLPLVRLVSTSGAGDTALKKAEIRNHSLFLLLSLPLERFALVVRHLTFASSFSIWTSYLDIWRIPSSSPSAQDPILAFASPS